MASWIHPYKYNSYQSCTSCDHNQLGEFKCKVCDDIFCQKCLKSLSRLRITRTNVVEPI